MGDAWILFDDSCHIKRATPVDLTRRQFDVAFVGIFG